MEEIDTNMLIDAHKLSLGPDLILPPKFKVLQFKKYDGIGCPMAYLTMFYRKMADHTQVDKLLIHYFQESLIGSMILPNCKCRIL